jgi:F-type H+-transporting ATPase subunit delta
MSQRTIARRYANALYDEAADTGVLSDVDSDVSMLRDSLSNNDELSRFFENPVIPPEKKKSILDTLLDDRVCALTLQFLRFLIAKDRETLTSVVLDAYQNLRDEHKGVIDVEARVAQPLSDDDRDALKETLEEKTGKTVRLHEKHVPDLIGGIIIQIGDHVYDGSVRNKLSSLRSRLHQTATASINGDA